MTIKLPLLPFLLLAAFAAGVAATNPLDWAAAESHGGETANVIQQCSVLEIELK